MSDMMTAAEGSMEKVERDLLKMGDLAKKL